MTFEHHIVEPKFFETVACETRLSCDGFERDHGVGVAATVLVLDVFELDHLGALGDVGWSLASGRICVSTVEAATPAEGVAHATSAKGRVIAKHVA